MNIVWHLLRANYKPIASRYNKCFLIVIHYCFTPGKYLCKDMFLIISHLNQRCLINQIIMPDKKLMKGSIGYVGY